MAAKPQLPGVSTMALLAAVGLLASGCDSSSGNNAVPSAAGSGTKGRSGTTGGATAAASALPSATATASASAKPQATGWKIDSSVTVVVRGHRNDLQQVACAWSGEVRERRCFFKAPNVAWPQGAPGHNNKLVPLSAESKGAEPKRNLFTIGFWEEQAVKLLAKTCNKPFLVRCQFEVWGVAKEASVRWRRRESWFPAGGAPFDENVYVGRLSKCRQAPSDASDRPQMFCPQKP